MVMNTYLKKLNDIVISKNIPALKFLQPGIDYKTLQKDLNVSEDSFVAQTLSWHNGTNINYEEPGNVFYIFPGFYLQSMQDVFTTMASDKVYHFKDKNVIPLLYSGQGEFLAVPGTSDSNTQPVFYCSTWNPGFDLYTPIYDSCESMMETIIEYYESNAYFIDQGVLDKDIEMEERIAAKRNPKAIYWK